jgi:hypothetical protein
MVEQRIIDELKKLTNIERLAIAEAALDMIHRDMQKSHYITDLNERKRRLTEAAKALLDDYMNDDELTAFTALDSEDFHV